MNVAGKSLQDIYDAGSRRLDELEQAEKGSLSDTADAHLDERARIEPDALKQLEDRTGELEDEIRSYLARGLERVQKTVEAESEESEQHISRLVEGLVLITKKFSESIAQLRKLAESQLTDLGQDCEHVYSLHAQRASSELLQSGTVSVAEAREEVVASERKIGSQIGQAWDNVYQQEFDALESISAAFDKDSEQATERFEQSRKSLEERAEERLTQLQTQARSSRESIKALVDQLIETSDRYAFDTDVKLKEGFSSQLYELTTSFDDSAARAGGEMTSLHESSMADLTMKSQELSREMDSLAESMTGSARAKSRDLQNHGSTMLENYTNDQTAKLDASNVFHKELASERSQMVSEIWTELSDLKQRFDDKLKALSTSTLDKMRSICDEAETAIVSAQHNCCSDSKSNASTKTESIDSAARDFLRRIEETRRAALDGIAKAAGDDPSSSKETKKGKKTQEVSKASPEPGAEDDEDASDEHDLNNPRPAEDNEEGAGEGRKRRKSRDKRSQGDAKR